MLSLPLPVKIFWSVAPTDMRKSFDSLSALVADQLGHDPLSGHLFVFTSRRRDRVKLLYFEKGGLAIWYKRLEEGTFAAPKPSSNGKSVKLSAEELSLLLAGVDLASVQRRKRFEPATA
jgi:transposase